MRADTEITTSAGPQAPGKATSSRNFFLNEQKMYRPWGTQHSSLLLFLEEDSL